MSVLPLNIVVFVKAHKNCFKQEINLTIYGIFSSIICLFPIYSLRTYYYEHVFIARQLLIAWHIHIFIFLLLLVMNHKAHFIKKMLSFWRNIKIMRHNCIFDFEAVSSSYSGYLSFFPKLLYLVIEAFKTSIIFIPGILFFLDMTKRHFNRFWKVNKI